MAMEWIISAFTLVSWRNGHLEIKSLASGTLLTSNDIGILRLVHEFAQPQSIEEVILAFGDSEKKVRTDIDRLIQGRVLIPAVEAKKEAIHPWGWSALAYHQESRKPGFQKTHAPEASASTSSKLHTKNWIPLTKGYIKKAREFTDVLEVRRSGKAWSSTPMSMATFSLFLWMSARNRDPLEEPLWKNQVSRPYPSGGGVYSLELYIVLAENAVEEIAAGLYGYLPDHHGLYPITDRFADFLPFLEAAGSSAGSESPPVVILITSRFAEQSAVYGNLAYSLILKEVGCLFQTFYLAGEYLHLNCCALGGGTPNTLLARLCNTNEVDSPLVGEFMLGPA